MTLLQQIGRWFFPQEQPPGSSKGSFPKALSRDVVHRLYELYDEGMIKEDIAEELGISEKSVERYLKAKDRRERPAGANATVSGIEQTTQLIEAVQKLTEKFSNPGAAAPAKDEPYQESSEDIIEGIRAQAAKRLANDQEYINYVVQEMKAEMLGGAATKRKTAADRIAEAIEARVTDEFLNGGRRNEDGGDWRGTLEEIGRDMVRPLLESAFPGLKKARHRELAQGPTEALPPPAPTQAAQDVPRLLGALTPEDMRDILQQEGAGDAAELACDLLDNSLDHMDTPAKAKVLQDLSGFLMLPEAMLRPLLSTYESDPHWSSAISTLFSKPAGWMTEFRATIRATMFAQGDEEDEDEAEAAAASAPEDVTEAEGVR